MIKSIRKLLAWHQSLKQAVQRIAQICYTGKGESDPGRDFAPWFSVPLRDDGPKGEAGDAIVMTAFGIKVRADRLNVAGVCDLKNLAPEFYSM